jgi:hypothetical protein
MVSIAGGYELDVDRGPNWLFVKVQPTAKPTKQASQIADEIWSISSRHFIYRLVLELDQFDTVPEDLIDQILTLQERLAERGGSLKLCGVSPECEGQIHERHLEESLRIHESRVHAVLGNSTHAR